VDVSVLIPMVPDRVEKVTAFAALVKFSGAKALWQGQSLKIDAGETFSGLAGVGLSTPVGIGVSLMPFRHPYYLALEARSIAAAVGNSVLAGIGPGSPELQASIRGAPYESPLRATREYLAVVKGLLSGRHVTAKGKYFMCDAALPAMQTLPVTVGLGVLRPGMAGLAGEDADAAITWLAPASYLSEVIVPAMSDGAKKTGRSIPKLVVIVPVALVTGQRKPVEYVLAGSAPHLQGSHYLDMLRRAGADVKEGRLVDNAEQAIRVGAFLVGDLDEIQTGLSDYKAAGVDEVVLNLTGTYNISGSQVALEDAKTIVDRVCGPAT